MPTRERNDSGRYVETLTLETVREAVRDAPDPIATTKEVADALGCSREAARLKLTELHDAGRIARRKVGSKAIVWWVPDSDDVDGETTPARAVDRRDAAGTRESRAEAIDVGPDESPGSPAPRSDASVTAVETAIANADLPGSGAKLDARRDALRAVVAYLREHGAATPADFRNDVYPEHPAGYTTGKAPARSWWKNALYPSLREVADATGVIERADTTGEWAWIGDDVGSEGAGEDDE